MLAALGQVLVIIARGPGRVGIGGVSNFGRDFARLAIAQEGHLDLLADPQQAYGVAQFRGGFDLAPVETGDNVTGADAGARGRRILDYLGHEGATAARDAERLGNVRRHGRDRDAELAALDRAETDQLIHDAARHVHRNRKADADVAAATRENHVVDADELAAQVDERAAGVARIDRGVGLDEAFVTVRTHARAAERTDDAVRHRLL